MTLPLLPPSSKEHLSSRHDLFFYSSLGDPKKPQTPKACPTVLLRSSTRRFFFFFLLHLTRAPEQTQTLEPHFHFLGAIHTLQEALPIASSSFPVLPLARRSTDHESNNTTQTTGELLAAQLLRLLSGRRSQRRRHPSCGSGCTSEGCPAGCPCPSPAPWWAQCGTG